MGTVTGQGWSLRDAQESDWRLPGMYVGSGTSARCPGSRQMGWGGGGKPVGNTA